MSENAKRLRQCAETMRKYKAACIDAYELDRAASEIESLHEALKSIIDRSNNGELGTSKVIDMRSIAEQALTG